MARDLRKGSAYDSGMRGTEKPKISPGNVQGEQGTSQPTGETGGENKQAAGRKVGHPEGISLDAYSSGMRGPEKPRQKSADAATQSTGDAGGAGSSHQQANSSVGNPKGDATVQHLRDAMGSGEAQKKIESAQQAGIPGNSTETANNMQNGPSFEDDDTHIHIKVPKTAFKKRMPNV